MEKKTYSVKSILSVAETYFKMASGSLNEAADPSAEATAATERAKNTPSAATHNAAAAAHEKAVSHLEDKIDSIKSADHTGEKDAEVMQHERQAKEHQQQAQRHRFHAFRLSQVQNESTQLMEKLDPHADAGVWIKDFQASNDPRFAGKSAEDRKQQALAAWYAARREAGIKNEDTGEAGDPGERPEVELTPDKDNLAATDAADAQKKQEPQPEIPSWVPGNLPDDEKKEFAEAAKKAWESDNNTFDFKGRTYKITENTKNEELVGNQHKLDVNKNGKIDAKDLAALRAGKKPVDEDHMENEVETPGQTEYPGSGMKDANGNGEIDGEDKAEVKESAQLNEGPGQSTYARVATDRADEASKRANSYGGQDYHLHMIAHHSHALAAKSHERAADNADDENTSADHSGGASYHHDQADHHLKAANALKEGTISEASAAELGHKARTLAAAAKTPADHKAAAKAHAKAAEAYRRYTTGNAGKNPGKSEEAAHAAALAHEKMADKHHEKSMKESVDNPTDKLTLDVPAMIRALEKAREDFKSDADIHNFVQGLLNKKDADIKTNDLPGEVKEGGPGTAEAGPMVMDPVTQQTKDDHDEETKVEEAPYTNKADGSENIVPADKPQPKPTPMNKVTGEQATKSVAEAYANMVAESTEILKAHAAGESAAKATAHAEKTGKQEDHETAYRHHHAAGEAYVKASGNSTNPDERLALDRKAAHHYARAGHHAFVGEVPSPGRLKALGQHP